MDGLENVAGVEEQVVAEPTTEVTENPTVEVTETEPTNGEAEVTETAPTGKTEEDSRFASVRRKAEEEARAKYEAETSTINNEFKRVFGGYKNPETGKAIESWKDYLDAIEAQNRKAQEDAFKEKGIDTKALDEYIQNSPAMRQAQEILAQNQKAEAERQLNEDIKAVGEIDNTIKSVDDLVKHPSYSKVLDLVQNNGLSIPDAYKLANYADLNSKHNAAMKQAAINQAKGKNHLETSGNGTADNSNLVDIPQAELATWKKYYPGLSDTELKAKYNKTI